MSRYLIAAFAALFAVPLHAEDLEVRGDRLFLSVEVHGEPVQALVDSGAEVTIFDTSTARHLRLGKGAAVEARGTGASTTRAELVNNISVTALGRDLLISTAAIMDLSDVGARLLNAPLPMILGRELFDANRVLVDIEGGRIEWLDDVAVPEGIMLDLTAAHGIETIKVGFGAAGEQAADFDLGNGSDLLISSTLASQLALTPVGTEEGGGIGGAVSRPVVYVPELTIAGKTFRNVRAQVSADARVHANVGVSLLREFIIVTDFPKRRVWLQPR